jgi:hypothetical protein
MRLITLILFAAPLFAQIAPECEGVTKPLGYDEEKQRTFLNNFAIASFVQPFSLHGLSSDEKAASAGLSLGYIPPLSCRERLAMNGTKTEDSNKTPIVPTVYLSSRLLKYKDLSLSLAVNLLPPLPIPHLRLWHLGADLLLSYEILKGINLHARTALSLSYIYAELASPLSNGDPIVDDWMSLASIGADLGSSFRFPINDAHSLSSFLTFGFIKGASIFVVGDDSVAVPNEKSPLFSPSANVGFAYRGFHEQLQITLSIGGAIRALMLPQLLIAYGF